MGTGWSVQAYAEGRLSVAALTQGAQRRLDAVVAQMSGWESGSDLSRFARLGPGDWLDLPDGFSMVMAEAMRVAAVSDGAFDPSVAALTDLWGFGPPGPRERPPTDAEIDAARAVSGWTRLELDRGRRRLRQPGGAGLDLSGIAKGFGVDEVAGFLDAEGVDSYLVEVGGELRGRGVKADGSPWWAYLEQPPGAGLTPMVAALYGLSVATSGDYRRIFEHGGRRYAHTLDPRTGRPTTNGVASVSVLHPSCMTADALATAIGVMGVEVGLALAEAQGVACRIIRRTGDGFEERVSAALEAMLD